MTVTQRTFIIVSLFIAIFALPTKADYRQDSRTIKASGGEDHTLILTADKGAWACGPNGGNHPGVGDYWGVLGTGNTGRDFYEPSLV